MFRLIIPDGVTLLSLPLLLNGDQVYTAFDRHLDALGVYKLDTIGDAFVVVAGLDGFKSQEASESRVLEGGLTCMPWKF